MLLLRQNAPPYHAPTRAREVFRRQRLSDGHGYRAFHMLALSAGCFPEEAAEIANHASGVVVGKLGTATLTPAELLGSFEV